MDSGCGYELAIYRLGTDEDRQHLVGTNASIKMKPILVASANAKHDLGLHKALQALGSFGNLSNITEAILMDENRISQEARSDCLWASTLSEAVEALVSDLKSVRKGVSQNEPQMRTFGTKKAAHDIFSAMCSSAEDWAAKWVVKAHKIHQEVNESFGATESFMQQAPDEGYDGELSSVPQLVANTSRRALADLRECFFRSELARLTASMKELSQLRFQSESRSLPDIRYAGLLHTASAKHSEASELARQRYNADITLMDKMSEQCGVVKGFFEPHIDSLIDFGDGCTSIDVFHGRIRDMFISDYDLKGGPESHSEATASASTQSIATGGKKKKKKKKQNKPKKGSQTTHKEAEVESEHNGALQVAPGVATSSKYEVLAMIGEDGKMTVQDLSIKQDTTAATVPVTTSSREEQVGDTTVDSGWLIARRGRKHKAKPAVAPSSIPEPIEPALECTDTENATAEPEEELDPVAHLNKLLQGLRSQKAAQECQKSETDDEERVGEGSVDVHEVLPPACVEDDEAVYSDDDEDGWMRGIPKRRCTFDTRTDDLWEISVETRRMSNLF